MTEPYEEVPCPGCGAAVDEDCATERGGRRPAHPSRRREWERAQPVTWRDGYPVARPLDCVDKVLTVLCPLCGEVHEHDWSEDMRTHYTLEAAPCADTAPGVYYLAPHRSGNRSLRKTHRRKARAKAG